MSPRGVSETTQRYLGTRLDLHDSPSDRIHLQDQLIMALITDLGWLSENDPRYKSGWTISFGQHSEQERRLDLWDKGER